MSGVPRILFVADAGPEVGGGHVMRSLTLAGALQAHGAACTFMSPPAVETILETYAPATARLITDSTRPEALFMAAQAASFDAIVFDHYGLAQPDHRAMAQGRPAMVIDDLANRPLGADLVLDSGPQRTAEDYAVLVPDGARLLLGAAYAPVRPEFAALRGSALAHRQGPVRRILVSFGLTDVGGITSQVVDRLRPRMNEAVLDIVLGAAAPSRPGLEKMARRDSRLNLHIDATDMARLTADADIGVGAAGSATWERCTLGLPSVILVLADNQRAPAKAMADAGAALVVEPGTPGYEAAFDRAVTRLMIDAALRDQMTRRSAETCDGMGAGRAADAFLQMIRDIPSQAEPVEQG